MTGHSSEVSNVAFGPEGQVLSGGSDRSMYSMYLWDLKTGRKVEVYSGHAGHVRYVAYSDRAKLAATCGADHSIRLWNLDTGTFRTLTGRSFYNEISVCFSTDGKRLVSAGYDHIMRIWDVETGKELKQIKDMWINCAAFSPDGQRIVTGGDYNDNTVRVWDAVTGKELRKYEGHTAGVTTVAFCPDGKRIASASVDGTARIWRAPR